MDRARTLISLGRAARNTAKLRVRQPLAAATIVERTRVLDAPAYRELVEHIKEELNVKEVRFAPSVASLGRLEVRPRFDLLGPKFGGQITKVVEALRAEGEALLARTPEGEPYRLRLPDGMSYRVLVLPKSETMTPEAVRKVAALVEAGFRCFRPRGAYYVMTDISKFGFDDDVSFARYLVQEVGVATVPGSSFYRDPRDGARQVRFAFCKKPETLDEAARKLERLRAGFRG
jgi:hypothetical protein